jgi:hypothetical protein
VGDFTMKKKVTTNIFNIALIGSLTGGTVLSVQADSLRVGTFGGETLTSGNTVVHAIESYIPVSTLLQEPELPNGCEIVSLTAILNYYGYNVSKVIMADQHLPKQDFIRVDGKLFGPDPYKTYAGSPFGKVEQA